MPNLGAFQLTCTQTGLGLNSQDLWSSTARRYTFLCALPVDLSFDGGGTVDTDPLDRDDQGASVRDFLTCRRGSQRHAYSLRTIHMGDLCIVHSSARCISLSGKQRALL